MDIASDFALRAAETIAGGLAAFMLIHLGWSWATAPRRIFYRQQSEIDDLNAKAAAEAVQRRTPNDALEMVERLIPLAGQTTPLEEWFTVAFDVLNECFHPHVSNSFRAIRDNGEKALLSRDAQRGKLTDHIQMQATLIRKGHTLSLKPKYLGP